MSAAKFTEAPWQYLEGEDNSDESDAVAGSIFSANGYHVARIWSDCGDDPDVEVEANANLIAAAPEMYAEIEKLRDAIKFLHGIFQTTYAGEARIAEADQLLKKARGES